MGAQIMFYILAIIIVVFSLLAVTSRKVMRATTYLLFVLIATGGLYFLIDYNFMGGVQLIVYAGGIVALIVFAVMLTQKIDKKIHAPEKMRMIMAALLSIVGSFLTIYVLLKHPFEESTEDIGQSVSTLGQGLLNYGDNGYVLPFELVSVLLLASMIAAIVVAKRKFDN
ncbi:MAG TPA: NADH-quinone oxidoreductase subunit J [Bacteroidetes bacterium]|jgi:NADH-quinone oxidoreductase subunit J|nr:NADH-quinone oxidoreductase subunit J [Bacteroidota bacterium]